MNQPPKKELFKTPVIILAGGALLMDPAQVEKYREMIRDIMTGFKGTIISGGTTIGIPGLAGEVKAELDLIQKVQFRLIAYIPAVLPENAIKSMAYDEFCETDATQFSELEIHAYWHDLLAAGIKPEEVTLIGIEGGPIAMKEYQIALEMGARVKLVGNSGRAVDELLSNDHWKRHKNLSILSPI
jgi:hypothetical protein